MPVHVHVRMPAKQRAGEREKESMCVRIPGMMAASTLAGSVKSTKEKSMPYFMNCMRQTRLVPPYEQSVMMQWSPFAKNDDSTETYVCMYITYMYMNKYMDIGIYVCVYVFLCVCTYVYMYV